MIPLMRVVTQKTPIVMYARPPSHLTGTSPQPAMYADARGVPTRLTASCPAYRL